HNKKSGYVFAPDEKNLLPSRARFYRVRRASTARLGCCRGTAETSVGLLQRAGRSALGKRWSAHDAAERTALHRSGWRRLDRDGRHWKHLRGVAGAIAVEEETVPRALPVSEEEIQETRSWIENANPSLSQIEARADAPTQ